KVRFDVATPSLLNGTAFWTTIVNTDSVGPMPTPVMNIHTHRTGRSVFAWMPRIRDSPPAMIATPARMIALYLPVRATSWPAMIELKIRPASSASDWRPESVGLTPFTNWNHWGRKMIAPKKPKLIRNVEVMLDA